MAGSSVPLLNDWHVIEHSKHPSLVIVLHAANLFIVDLVLNRSYLSNWVMRIDTRALDSANREDICSHTYPRVLKSIRHSHSITMT